MSLAGRKTVAAAGRCEAAAGVAGRTSRLCAGPCPLQSDAHIYIHASKQWNLTCYIKEKGENLAKCDKSNIPHIEG